LRLEPREQGEQPGGALRHPRHRADERNEAAVVPLGDRGLDRLIEQAEIVEHLRGDVDRVAGRRERDEPLDLVLRRLRHRGHVELLVGGCVRHQHAHAAGNCH